jgi:hypothetical protein
MLFAILRGQSAVISSDHSNSLAFLNYVPCSGVFGWCLSLLAPLVARDVLTPRIDSNVVVAGDNVDPTLAIPGEEIAALLRVPTRLQMPNVTIAVIDIIRPFVSR